MFNINHRAILLVIFCSLCGYLYGNWVTGLTIGIGMVLFASLLSNE